MLNKPFGYYFWCSNGDGTESPEFCRGEIPSWKQGVKNIIPLYAKSTSDQHILENTHKLLLWASDHFGALASTEETPEEIDAYDITAVLYKTSAAALEEIMGTE